MRMIAGFVLALSCAAMPAFAQQPTELSDTVERTIDAHRRAQAVLDAWATEKADLEARKITAASFGDYLEKRRAFEQEQVKALGAAIQGLQEQIDQFQESIAHHEHLADTLAVLIARLDAFVAADLPFRAEERTARVRDLRAAAASDSVSSAETLRLLFDALDAEAQYSAGVETYRDRVTIGAETIDADVLRVGRVGLYWRGSDGKRVGEFDRAKREWVELPGNHAREIARAMEMAAGNRKTEIVILPLGKVQR